MPFAKYQKQRIIQKVVRIPESLYVMNVGALTVYQNPSGVPGSESNVNWNQMSDRVVAHVQARGPAGISQGGNSRRRTVTCLRPGALSPGGSGVDIKHNSYDRYLARLKGKSSLRQQPIPANFASPNVPASGINGGQGGKVIKMGVLANCTCGPDPYKSIIAEGECVDLNYNGPCVPCEFPDDPHTPYNIVYGLTNTISLLPLCTYNVDTNGRYIH
jgi:hypothetical protein